MLKQEYQNCVNACLETAQACDDCATACMKESNVLELSHCIKLNQECAVICRSAAELIGMKSDYSLIICHLVATACSDCAEECEHHAAMGMEHCKVCAEICRNCVEVTNVLLGVVEKEFHEEHLVKADPGEAVEAPKKKKKHSSALVAASLWRSPVGHSMPHTYTDVKGSSGLGNTGPYPTYEQDR